MDDAVWVELREGIKRRSLAKNPEKGIQADIIRIVPNFCDSPHIHDDFEWAYILEGELIDEKGTHKKGDFIINTTEGIHQPRTGPAGCEILIVWCGSVTKV